ncbi:hypothetical protein KR093_000685, partial [Drosophila rubida]
IIIPSQWSSPQIVFKMKNLECNPNPKYVENASCLIKAKNWNNAVAQMDCDLIIPLRNVTASLNLLDTYFIIILYNNILQIQLEVFKKGYNNRFHPFLINTTVKMCEILSKRNYATYGTIMQKILKDFSNINHSCPYTGHMYARNLFIDANYSFIPKFPVGFYMMSFTITENFSNMPSQHVGNIKYYMQAAEMVQIRK